MGQDMGRPALVSDLPCLLRDPKSEDWPVTTPLYPPPLPSSHRSLLCATSSPTSATSSKAWCGRTVSAPWWPTGDGVLGDGDGAAPRLLQSLSLARTR